MRLLLIADKDINVRRQMTEIFDEPGYEIIAPESVDIVLRDVLKKDAKVVLLGSEFDDMPAKELIPLLKRCNRDLTIILVSDEESLPLLRKFRREGIFYHALRPINKEDREELRLAVRCAFENSSDKLWSARVSHNNHGEGNRTRPNYQEGGES
jgi:DNA-binding NtrC family response regulator